MLKKPSPKNTTLIFSWCSYAILSSGLLAAADVPTKSKQLQGEIEQGNDGDPTMSKPASATMDQSKSSGNYIKGQIQQENGEAGTESPLAGNEDPDATDKELMIEWDRWRNRFLQAVLGGTTDALNNDQARNFQFNPQTNVVESKYPMGTNAWFSCKITKDGHIKEVLIEKSSGFSGYDDAVRESVQSLEGSAILKFPSRSRRISVLQAGGVERTAQVNKQYFHFGDTEHYRVPGY
jgi:hypothetical protein